MGRPDESIESGRVEFGDPQRIMGSAAHNRATLPTVTLWIEVTTQFRHSKVQSVDRRFRDVVPHFGEKLIRAHRVRICHSKCSKQGALAWSTEIDGCTVTERRDRTENTH